MMRGNELHQGANRDYAGKLGAQAEFEAQSAAWEAKNAFASHASAMGGIAGMNTGALTPGAKPQEMNGLAMSGMLSQHTAVKDGKAPHGWSTQTVQANDAGAAASFSGNKLPEAIDDMVTEGMWGANGGQAIENYWSTSPGGGTFSAGGAVKEAGSHSAVGNNYFKDEGEAGYLIGAAVANGAAGFVDGGGLTKGAFLTDRVISPVSKAVKGGKP
jgi:hypothetical protein